MSTTAAGKTRCGWQKYSDGTRRAAMLSWLGWCAEYGYDGP
ncbi:hypothetical protein [Streptomyces cuspidosporus]|uniref:Transposase n=1 Tax=Streptomyces cuspidosporus TaxID=66882 RepID=A0ABN3FC16_9ACTN